MLKLSDAQQLLWQQAVPISGECLLPLADALGAVAARSVFAHLAVPPADNSAMDGYALRWADTGQPLEISQRIAAGSAAQALSLGTAARIFTGGEIPLGADTVVMQEHTQLQSDGRVLITTPATLGANIRPKGQDVAPGTCLVAAGTRLNPVDLALLASQGLSQVAVIRPCKVALVTTGSELVEPGLALQAGQIYNSNSTLISTTLQYLNVEVFTHNLADDPIQTQQLLAQLAGCMDVIITTGGVSAGEEDHVKSSIAALGQVEFWKIAVKPGKPFMYGRIGTTPVLGLPGNPVSSFITYVLLAKPFIQALQGGTAQLPLPRRLPVAAAVRAGEREEFVRAQLSAAGLVPLGNQSSGVLRSLQQADGLMRLPTEQSLRAGDSVEFWFMHELLAP